VIGRLGYRHDAGTGDLDLNAPLLSLENHFAGVRATLRFDFGAQQSRQNTARIGRSPRP
jgi:hypothetical protein